MSPLPKWSDETVLWEGAPGWLAVARTIFHVRFVALYFALVIVADAARNRLEGLPRLETIRAELPLVALAALSCAIVLLLAWMTARTTAYAITDRRVVVRFGIAFPATLSLPLRMIQEVQVRVHPDHSGDIPLRLPHGKTVSYTKLWPMVRRMTRAQPMLRAVPQAGLVASLLSRHLAEKQREALTGLRQAEPPRDLPRKVAKAS